MDLRIMIQNNDGSGKYYIDNPDTNLWLNYSLADIKNFGAKNSNYSRTITIPSSKNNNKVFNHIFNINRYGGFDETKYTQVWVTSNGILVMAGNLQLTTINSFDDGRLEYECLIFGGVSVITDKFGDELLFGNDDYTKDLRMGVAHTISSSSITNSFSATQSFCYILPNLNDYNRFQYDRTPVVNAGSLSYSANQVVLYPNKDILNTLFYYEVIDKLIASAGFTWTSSIKNTSWFKKILLLGKTNFDKAITKEGFNQNVEKVLYLVYNTDHNHNPKETKENGVLLFDMYDQTLPEISVKRNSSVIISSSKASFINQNVSDTEVLINNLDNLKDRIEYRTASQDVPHAIRTGNTVNDWSKLPLVTNFLDRTHFSQAEIDNKTTYQSRLDGIVTDDPVAVSGSVFTAPNDMNVSFSITGTLQVIANTTMPPPGVPEMTIKIMVYAERTQSDGTKRIDIIGRTDNSIVTLNNLFGNGNNTETASFSLLTYYTSLKEGDKVFIGFDNTGNSNESVLKIKSSGAVVTIPYNTSYTFNLRFTNVVATSQVRFSPYGLMSFHTDQTIRVIGDVTASGLPTGSKLRFVDVGNNGKYYEAFRTDTDFLFEYPILNNQQITFDEVIEIEKGYNRYALVIVFSALTDNTDMRSTTVNVKSGSEIRITAVCGTGITTNDTNIYLPDNTTKTDFFSSFLKLFNLYVSKDVNDSKNLIIEPYNEYFSQGKKVDWTKKLDLSSGIKINLTSEYLKEKTTLTYASDSDNGNSSFSDRNKDAIYGQYIITNDNQLAVDEDTIEVLFAPTMYYTGEFWNNSITPYAGMIIPELNGGSTPRLLFKGGVANINSITQTFDPKLITTGQIPSATASSYPIGIDNTITYSSSYPIVGHIEDLTNTNSYDLNFGSVDLIYLKYALVNSTSRLEFPNNLFKTYYEQSVNDVKTSKLITARFYLTEYDINTFDYNDLIVLQIKGSNILCRVNKIKDYNPCNDLSTEVELISLPSYTS